ncbi:MAG: PEP-CTERM sorting domain-containing protein, partial [Betaproteobacteria bacterium]
RRRGFDGRPRHNPDAGLGGGAGPGARASAWSGGAVIDLNTRTINLGQFELVGGFSHVNNRGQIVTLANPTAAGVAAGLRPTAVLLAACTDTCGQIKPFPNPPGTTLRIDGDWFDAFNEEDFVNSGRLELDTSVHNRGEGWLRGSGTVAVGAAGWVRNSARWSVGEGGRLELNGLFSQDADGATFFSRGTVAIGAEPALFDVARGSAVFDTGALVVQAAGVVRVGPSASWLMSGASFEQLGGVLGVQGTASLRGSQATVGGVLQVDGTLRVVPEPALATRSRVVVGGTGELALRGGSVLELRSADLEVQGGTVRSQAQASLEGSARLRVRDGGRLELNAHRLRVLDGAELQVEDAGTQARVAAGARLETVGPLAALRVRDGAELVVSGTLVNGGNLDLRDGGRLELGGLAAGLLNQPGALLQVGSGSELDLQADSVFVNEGQVALNGTVVVATGAELVSRSTGAITFAGGRLDVTGGRFAIDLGGRVDGLGTVHQTAGLTVVDGRLDNSAVVIDGGVLQGSGTVSATLVVGPGATVALGATPAAARPAAGAVAAREASLRSGASAAAAGGLRLEGAAEIQGATLALPVADWRARGGLSVADGGSLALVDARVQLNAEVGYGPDLNDRFRVLDAAGGSLTGADTLALEATGLAGGWAAALEPTAGGGARVRIDHAAAQSFGFDTIAPGVRVELAAGQLNDIAGGRLVVSEGELVIGGALAVREDAFLTSTGTLHIAPGGRLSTRGSVGQSGGEPLLNEGLLRVYEEGSLGHSAPLRNRGLIENAGAWFASSRVDNEAGARIVQIGQMSSFWLRNEGRFELEGEVVNSGWVDNLEGGVFVVAEGGSLRTAELNSGRYRDQLGRTQVDGRLQAEVVEFQGSRVSGRGVIAGTVGGDATFELGDGGAAPLTIEGVFGGVHAFELDITDAARFGTLTLLGDTALTGGLVTFWLTEGGYLPQAGDSFSWIAVSGDAASLATLDWRVMVRAEGFDYAWVPPDELSLSFDGRTLAVAVVPEPSTYGLMLAGLGLVAWLKRRRDGAAAATR